MEFRRRDVIKVVSSSAAAAAVTKIMPRMAWASEPKRIQREVCVIGGGSAGTYTAVRLRNLGKSVVVLEAQSRLGGHAQTEYVGGLPINIGVQVFEGQNPLVTSYCAQLGVPLVGAPLGGGPAAANVDFRTGAPVNVAPVDPVAFGTAMGTFLQILQTEFPYLDGGFNLPNPVPADLLMPFGDFITKYSLDALLPTAFQFGQGVGDMLANPAIYMLKLFGLSVVGAIATDSFVAVPAGTAAIYDAAATFLGADALVNAQVLGAVRYPDHVEVFADTPDGPVRVEAGKLVFAIPPTLRNLALIAPDETELSLFRRFRSTYYATSLVHFEGLPPGVAVNNAAQTTRANIPPLPSMYGLEATEVPGYFVGLFGAQDWMPDAEVEHAMTTAMQRVAASGIYPGMKLDGIEVFSSHVPFHLTVTARDIADGFYARVNALQGQNRTFYTGAAFQTNDSSQIWRFTEGLLPLIAS